MAEDLTDDQLWYKAERYDALVDWPKRLAYEEPFYRQLFEEVGVK